MEVTPAAQTGTNGVTRTQTAVQEGLGWLFREQPTADYGIDAQVEVVDGSSVKGRLLALQIKSGESSFKEGGYGGWWFRPDQKHVDYWLRHSLPVVVVLYNPATQLCHWELVSKHTLRESRGGNPKIFVPEDHVLNATATQPLREAAQGEPYELRLRELRLALPWMRRLAGGERLVVDMQEWVNKSSGRGSITLGIDHGDGKSPEAIAEWGVMLGLSDYAEVVPRLFAWANVDVHEETYDVSDYDEWEAMCVYYDGDVMYSESYEDWQLSRRHGLRPYRSGGEVEFWRLELTLNTLGRAFLEVDRFATTGERQLTLG